MTSVKSFQVLNAIAVILLLASMACVKYHTRKFNVMGEAPIVNSLVITPSLFDYQGSRRVNLKDTVFIFSVCVGPIESYQQGISIAKIDSLVTIDSAIIKYKGSPPIVLHVEKRLPNGGPECSGSQTVFSKGLISLPSVVDTVLATIFYSSGLVNAEKSNSGVTVTMIRYEDNSWGPPLD